MKIAIIGYPRPHISYQEWEQLLLRKINLDKVSELLVIDSDKCLNTFVRKFANSHNIPLKEYRTEQYSHGGDARRIRNEQIVADSDLVIAFAPTEAKETKQAPIHTKKAKKDAIVIFN